MNKDTIMHDAPRSIVSEAIRTLRTNLSYKMSQTGDKVFLITSSASGEGKSCIASNLAISFTQSNSKVLLMDCDLRKGRQNQIFSVNSNVGLIDAIDNKKICPDSVYIDEEIENFIQPTYIPNLFTIASGNIANNPSELLEDKKFDAILQSLKNKFDIIIIDAPPINIITDSMILCSKVDGVIIVCAAGITKRESLVDTKKTILNVGGKIVGVVLNRMPSDKIKDYSKNYTKYCDDKIVKVYRSSFKNMS